MSEFNFSFDELKKTIEKAYDLNPIIEIDGVKLWKDTKRIVDLNNYHNAIKLNSLLGMIEFINSQFDKEEISNLILLIDDHENVMLISKPNRNKVREVFARCELPNQFKSFEFGRYMQVNDFIIKMYSLFAFSEDHQSVIEKASKVKLTIDSEVSDDGSSTSRKSSSKVVSDSQSHIFKLAPYRTFREIRQVESLFIFRTDNNLNLALFEADGGSWIIETKQRIRDFILKEVEDLTIIM